MRIEADSVDEYLAQVPSKRREALDQLRTLILSTADDLVEDLAYGMPTYWVGTHVLCAFASQKNYMSLYLDVDLLAAHREAFGTLNCGKSCVRFTNLAKLPRETIALILHETHQRQRTPAQG